MRKSVIAIGLVLVSVFSSGARAESYRIYCPPKGGSCELFAAAYSNGMENHLWRWAMYFPRECTYEIRELGKSFRFVQQFDGRTLRGQHFELQTDRSVMVESSWVIPAVPFRIRDEGETGAVHQTGLLGEPEKVVQTEHGPVTFVKSWVLYQGRVYATWCQVEPSRKAAEPTPALSQPRARDEEPWEVIRPRDKSSSGGYEEMETLPLPSLSEPEQGPSLAPPAAPQPVLPRATTPTQDVPSQTKPRSFPRERKPERFDGPVARR